MPNFQPVDSKSKLTVTLAGGLVASPPVCISGQVPLAMVILQKRAANLKPARLESFLMRAKRAAGLRGTVNVLLTSSQEMRGLNARFRGKNYATDVLSFPPVLGNERFAGDIAISTDIAGQNARHLGHALEDEIRILMLHGLLHLAGYDHESDAGAMESKENLLRKKLKLPIGLIERALGTPHSKSRSSQKKSSHSGTSRRQARRLAGARQSRKPTTGSRGRAR